MSRSQYPYPPDEFDVRGPDDAPVGVHRAPRGRWASVWPFLLVAVLAVGLAVGGVMYLSRDSGSADDADPAPTATAPADAGTDAPAEGDTPAEGEGTDTPPAEEPPAEETPAESDLAALLAAANLDAHVRVLNGGGPQGEAGRGREALEAKGFTHVDADNYTGGASPSVTSVWYATDRAESAAAVAAVLGIPAENVSEQPIRSGDVVVIIRSALTPAG